MIPWSMEETGAVVPRLHSEGLEHGIGRLHETKDSTHTHTKISPLGISSRSHRH